MKSRRIASSSIAPKRTDEGRRPSLYSASARNVATSNRLVVDRDHADHAELRADRNGAVEHFLHDFGTRVGRDVVILGLDAEDSIAHTSAGENGAKAGFDQSANDVSASLFFVAHAGCAPGRARHCM